MNESTKIEYQHFDTSRTIINSKGRHIMVREPRLNVCYIRDSLGTSVGLSYCNNKKDNPCKRAGRKIALERAQQPKGSVYSCRSFPDTPSTIHMVDVQEHTSLGALFFYSTNPNFRFTRKHVAE